MTTIRPLFDVLWRGDRRLTATGLTMLAVLAATGVGLLVDPRDIGGAPAWMKPAKFAASIGIYTLTPSPSRGSSPTCPSGSERGGRSAGSQSPRS